MNHYLMDALCSSTMAPQIIPPGNRHQIALQEVSLASSGIYACQITLDAPPFTFVALRGNMTVISLPERFPVISGNKGHQNYRIGERVQLNCTCQDTYPPANLRWFINDHQVRMHWEFLWGIFGKVAEKDSFTFQVDFSYLVHYLPSKSEEEEYLFSSTLGLDFVVEDSHYEKSQGHSSKDRELWVKCEATMPPVEGMVFPYNREVFLGSYQQSVKRYDSISSSASSMMLASQCLAVVTSIVWWWSTWSHMTITEVKTARYNCQTKWVKVMPAWLLMLLWWWRPAPLPQLPLSGEQPLFLRWAFFNSVLGDSTFRSTVASMPPRLLKKALVWIGKPFQ